MLHWLLWYYTMDYDVPFEKSWPNRKQFQEWLGLNDEDTPQAGLSWVSLYCLDKLEFTEHGGVVSAGWLTPKGEAARIWLDTHGCNPDEWPDNAG